MSIIKSISCRHILNSHVQFTVEYILSLTGGATGIGAASQGETISIYEDEKVSFDPNFIIAEIIRSGLIGREVTQEEFDNYLLQNVARFGRNNIYALSEALFNANLVEVPIFNLLGLRETKLNAPKLCLNILNGGWHAYTNPVLSDFSEYILVAHSNNVGEIIGAHNEIQQVVRERLSKLDKKIINGNQVNCFRTADNRECVEFLLSVCQSLGYENTFDLWIDASAGDLWSDNGYITALTENKVYSCEQYLTYWIDFIRHYKVRFIEDPFREKDYKYWQALTAEQNDSLVIGDNFYSSNSERIQEGAQKQFAHGVLIKPNQAGTVTGVFKAIETAQRVKHTVITSHRSISTESTFISALTCITGVEYIKIGPLVSDYSSVVRLNEVIRLTGNSNVRSDNY